MSGSHENEVWVDDYVTSTGTTVSGHWRKRTHRGGGGEGIEPIPSSGGTGATTVTVDRRPLRAATQPHQVARSADAERQSRVNAGLLALRQRRTAATGGSPAQPELSEPAQRANAYNAAHLRDVDARAGELYSTGTVVQARSGSEHTVTEVSHEGLVTMSSGHQFRAADLTTPGAPHGGANDRCPSCGQFQGQGHVCPMPEGLPDGNYAELKGEERTKQMLADLQDSVTAIVQSGQLGRWLDAMASNGLNRWSFNNRMLSVLQVLQRDPKAELHLMGFRQWEKYNRKVSKGEKAVWILAPMTRKIREEDDAGKVRERTIVTGFKSVPVFNIDQTDGDPMPDSIVSHAGGDATPGTLEGLRERVGQAGYAYEETELPDYRNGQGTLGYTDPKTKKIVVDSRLDSAQKASTLAHELGHVHCGHVDGDYSEYLQHRGRFETEAEMTAYMVNRARGMTRAQADSFSPGYIAGWSRGKPEVVSGAMERATKAFNTIMDGPWSSSTPKE